MAGTCRISEFFRSDGESARVLDRREGEAQRAWRRVGHCARPARERQSPPLWRVRVASRNFSDLMANLREYWIGVRARRNAHGEGWGTALVRLVNGNRRRYGGYVSHLGIFPI